MQLALPRSGVVEISAAEHTQSIEALYTFKVFPCFAAGGIRTALSFGGVNCRQLFLLTAVKECPVAQTLAAA